MTDEIATSLQITTKHTAINETNIDVLIELVRPKYHSYQTYVDSLSVEQMINSFLQQHNII